MKSKQRLLGAIRGEQIDRVPWSPFLAYYWDYLPADVQARGQFAYLKEMGADPLLRGSGQLYKCIYRNCEFEDKAIGKTGYRAYHTPVGTLVEKGMHSDVGRTYFRTEHPVKTPEDFKILQYIHENMVIEPNYEQFEAELALYGDDALMLPLLGAHGKTAFQSLVEQWVGTENLVYMLYDEPEVVEECLAVMQARDEETVRVSVNSAADGFIFWEDSSTTNINPAMFEKYTKPEIDRWGELIHGAGKLLVHHACGHLKDLLPLMARSNIDAVESISPPPTGNVTLQEAAAILPEHIALIGGLEPVRLMNGTVESVQRDAMELMHDLAGRRFVLANSDSCPPNVEYEKFLAVTDLVRRSAAAE